MVVVMKRKASQAELDEVLDRIKTLGLTPHIMRGVERIVIGAIGNERGKARLESLAAMSGVEAVMPILKPYKLASKEFKAEPSIIRVGGVEIGGKKLVVIAGPCSIESEEQLRTTALAIKAAGAQILRGGAYKPRTSPYAFQGMEEDGLKLLAQMREETGLPVITEVMNPATVELVGQYTDILQIGARNVQNFPLLKCVGQYNKPVLLKRGLSTTIEEFLMSAEYILSEGNKEVILCERGIRTFETATRNTLDLSCIPVLKEETHLPCFVDPSHATGNYKYVGPMAKAAVAAGTDGLMIEVHPRPEEAYSDGPQSLKPSKFLTLMEELKPFALASGRTI